MKTIERLEAEVEALKIVCMSLMSRVDRFTWREVRDVANATASKDAEWRQAQPWTDQQLELLEATVDSLTGATMPTWQTPLLPTSLPGAGNPRRSRQKGQ